MNSVAVPSSVQIQTSQQRLATDTNRTGNWTLVSSKMECSDLIFISGEAAVRRVNVRWLYVNGSTSNGPLPPVSDSAELKPQALQVTDSAGALLVSGAEARGTADRDNVVRISNSEAALRSA
jgi:hypothetical protein